jgi:hypothetical protein
MNNNNPMALLYETLLSVPSMSENVKIDLRISRKQVLLLGQVIEGGLKSPNSETTSLLAALPEGTEKELSALIGEFMEKAGLTELNQKMHLLSASKSQ